MIRRLLSTSVLLASLMPLAAWAQEAAEHAESGGAMPQLEFATYPSQWFWLVVSGITLYVLMGKVALPRVAKMVDLRDAQVQRDLEQAYKLKQEAENLKINYTRALRDADEKAATHVDRSLQDIKDRNNEAIAQGLVRVNEQVSAAEASLRAKKDEVLSELNSIADKLAADVTRNVKRA